MISSQDTARLKKLSEGHQSSRLSDGELDEIPDDQIDKKVLQMALDWNSWKFIVNLTEKRSKDWWLRGMMTYFKDGLSLMELQDGRLVICTWSVSYETSSLPRNREDILSRESFPAPEVHRLLPRYVVPGDFGHPTSP